MRAVKNNRPTPSGEVRESEGPRPMRAVGIIPATPYNKGIARCGLDDSLFEHPAEYPPYYSKAWPRCHAPSRVPPLLFPRATLM